MASAATDIIRRIATEFAAVSDDTVDDYVAEAALVHDAVVWGARYTLAMACYAAHNMARDGLGTGVGTGGTGTGSGSTGAVASLREQDLSISFDTMAGQEAARKAATSGDVDLTTTRYGLRYLRLRDGLAGVSARLISVAPT